ncbi:hypothetical protein TBLA_0B05030 [Henningerozyma blattae CBS 6284]|uniref:Lysophospholipase n=1 Tax=Henningerozyma blattae (strain ATCC 34711 / CBS 6284 / DSM 70876 / NBRC 10599 / NRRL Y-10934 / UCD 77-7) TaxID=1071380 RepID=I2GYY6_HENB6|nr:hypothetical protein TBLA_0B05030 [Tetrapisispora blattae CBS 6284]CCH59338.1 hypothetical protein TBLA_0B05030 [Tetrapisispora blattae CBS 6284]
MVQLKNALVSTLVSTALVNAWSPSNNYAPSVVDCPTVDDYDLQSLNDTNPEKLALVRDANELSVNETKWVRQRNQLTEKAMLEFLKRATKNFTDDSILDSLFPANKNSSFSNNSLSSLSPKIGIAASGGGYRAMLAGAGMIAAMDNRTEGANEHGLGGLLQSSTYLAGLSGGNWLVGTLAWNNWTSVQDIINNMTAPDSIWDITNGFLSPGGNDTKATTARWSQILGAGSEKQKAGFPISIADYWGRALSYNFFPTLNQGGVAYSWSDLRNSEVFAKAEMPFPISVTDFRHPYAGINELNSTIVEFNPFEMGSWDPSLNSFADVKYIGTSMFNGTPVADKCVVGFDNVGFILGTSSMLFTPADVPFLSAMLGDSTVGTILSSAMKNDTNDVAIYAPNPFKGTNYGTNNYTNALVNADAFYLVDGGEDQIEIPLISLVQKNRDLDVIFALDNSADTNLNWPNGNGVVQAYERQFAPQGDNMAFPYVPSVADFVAQGLNKRPTFFGCDSTNLTDLRYIPPLIVYIPNSDYSYESNTSTWQLTYNTSERLSMISNGFESMTRNNFTDDPEFLSCVGCAIIRRKQQALNLSLPVECNQCFTDYCWNGAIGKYNSTSSNYTSSSYANSTSSISLNANTTTSSSSNTTNSTSIDNAKDNKKKNAAVKVIDNSIFHSYLAILGSALIAYSLF